MGDTTKISWCDHTMNFWIGCTNVSPACDHCYAESLAKRWDWAEWGAGKPRKRTSAANWAKPLQWERQAIKDGTRPRVFSLSLGDWADPEVPEAWRADMFEVIRATPHLEWLLLSKRHALVLAFLKMYAADLKNIRIGFTVESQKMARVRLPKLFEIKGVLGFPTFVSYEPALGPVEWRPWIECKAIDWLIAGGESGAGFRVPDLDWFRYARDVCAGGNSFGIKVPFHLKQHGGARPGAVLDGREHFEFPVAA